MFLVIFNNLSVGVLINFVLIKNIECRTLIPDAACCESFHKSQVIDIEYEMDPSYIPARWSRSKKRRKF